MQRLGGMEAIAFIASVKYQASSSKVAAINESFLGRFLHPGSMMVCLTIYSFPKMSQDKSTTSFIT